MGTIKIGWYSEQQRLTVRDITSTRPPVGSGRSVYLTPSGAEVYVTEVTNEGGQCAWPDARCVGPVTEWLRNA